MANSARLTKLISSLELQMAPVKDTRLGNLRFTVEKGALKLIEKIQGCWERFVDFIIRLFCALFGIKREIQSTFEQITKDLKEAADLAGVDTTEAKAKWETFKTEYAPVVLDMFKAGVKLDKVASCCLGGKAFSMDCLKSGEGREVQKTFKAFLRTDAEVKDSFSFNVIKNSLENFTSTMPNNTTVVGSVTIDNKKFFLKQLDGGAFFSTTEEIEAAAERLLAEVSQYMQMMFSLEPLPTCRLCGSYQRDGKEVRMFVTSIFRDGDRHQLSTVCVEGCDPKGNPDFWLQFESPNSGAASFAIRSAAEARETPSFKRIEKDVTDFAFQLSGRMVVNGSVTIGEKKFFLTQADGKTVFSKKEELDEAVRRLLDQVSDHFQMVFSPEDLPKNSFYAVCDDENELRIVMASGDTQVRGFSTYENVNQALAKYNVFELLVQDPELGWCFPHRF